MKRLLLSLLLVPWLGYGAINSVSGTGGVACTTVASDTSCNSNPAVVAELGTSNTFTSTNDFSAGILRIPTGAGVPSAATCNSSGHVGKVYMRNNAQAVNSSYYVCSSTSALGFAWELAQ